MTDNNFLFDQIKGIAQSGRMKDFRIEDNRPLRNDFDYEINRLDDIELAWNDDDTPAQTFKSVMLIVRDVQDCLRRREQ
jgi:hypothetical protein